MSLESFFEGHRPNRDTLNILAREKRNIKTVEPLQIYFARKMMSAAHESLVEKSNRVVSMDEMTKEAHERLVHNAPFELATIYFTAAIISLHECLTKDGIFSLNSYNGLINTALSSTGLKPFPKSEVPDEKIEPSNMKRMVKRADADPTLSFFFKAPYEFLPSSLRRGLKNALQGIEANILPRYERLATILVQSERKAAASERPLTKGFSISEIDTMIAKIEYHSGIKREEKEKGRLVPRAFKDAFS